MKSVSFISAFDTEKNIGGEYNRLIEQINDEWIFIKDGDSLFLTSDYGDKISQIIASNPQFDIIGAVTNRIASNELRMQKKCSDEADINYHIQLANRLWNENGTNVVKTDNEVAAFCMFFKRKIWEQIHFPENSLIFDKSFCASAISHGFKIGIAKGLYLFHLYRWGHDKPEYWIEHLKN